MMANNYLLFSELIPCEGEEKKGLLRILTDRRDDEDNIVTEFSEEDNGVWVYSDECADLELLTEAVSEWQRLFHIQDPWSLTFAETCSKPRLSEFGGGAVVVYKGEEHWMHVISFVETKIKELTGK